MDKIYFSHYEGGTYNTKGTVILGYNEVPDQPIALDPRTIIEEWTEKALRSLTFSEVYAGLQVYCLQDRCTRICRWTPTGIYTAADCVWDTIHTSDEDAWVDVRTMETIKPEELLGDRIARAEIMNYQFNIIESNGYWTISNNVIENDNYDKIIHDMVMYSSATEVNHIAGSF